MQKKFEKKIVLDAWTILAFLQKEAKETIEELRYLPIKVIHGDKEKVFKAATLKIYHSLSYADAFSASLAQSLKATLVTGDPELQFFGLNLQNSVNKGGIYMIICYYGKATED